MRDRFKDRPKKLHQWMHVWNGEYDAHGDEKRAFATAWAAVQKVDALSAPPLTGLKNRALYPFDAGTYVRHGMPRSPGQGGSASGASGEFGTTGSTIRDA